MPRRYFVYILASPSRTIYVGVTNDLKRRLEQHHSGKGSKFAAKYKVTRLVYVEEIGAVREAISREKQIKSWSRAKKTGLIESVNPKWEDLLEDN